MNAFLKRADAPFISVPGTLFLCIVLASCAQIGATRQDSSSIAESQPKAESQPEAESQPDAESEPGAAPATDERAAESAAPGPTSSDQQNASSGWSTTIRGRYRSTSTPVPGRYWCGPPIPKDEGFSEKVVRLLFGRDWCGPEDTGITAGGAAGGD